jgi:redox-sensitive bicupin YhaK (pirin superfamily)
MYATVLGAGDRVSHAIAPGRHAWIHCATGAIEVNGVSMGEGDGLAVSDERSLTMRGAGPSEAEVLVFDLA